MKHDIIVAGVGGQGILTIAYILDQTAAQQNLCFKQCEVHGMSQRGGAVESHVRISDQTVESDLIPEGSADFILSTEPLEALRYLSFLSPEGRVITSTTPFKNMATYPDELAVTDALRALPRVVMIDAGNLAQSAGSPRSQNMVMLGALIPFLSLDREIVQQYVEKMFATKSEAIQEANLKAYLAGYQASQ